MLRFAYLSSAVEPLMLIWGDPPHLDFLSSNLRLGRGVFSLTDTVGRVQIDIEVSDDGGGMSRSSQQEFVWRIRRDECGRFADLVDAVASSSTPCHHYLCYAEGRGLTVKVSKGEYPEDFLP